MLEGEIAKRERGRQRKMAEREEGREPDRKTDNVKYNEGGCSSGRSGKISSLTLIDFSIEN